MSIYKMNTSRWHVTRFVFLFAGMLVLLSLGVYIVTGNDLWLLLAAFVAGAEIIFALTGFCTMAAILARLGVPRD